MLYNALHVSIYTVHSFAVFKSRLKTYLFTQAYNVLVDVMLYDLDL